MYKDRNCTRFFPDEVKESPTDVWIPSYTVKVQMKGHMTEQQVLIQEMAQKECPVSILARHPDMEILAQEVNRSLAVKDLTGATLFGPDSSQWDCQWYDVIKLTVVEDHRVDDAIENHVKNMGE